MSNQLYSNKKKLYSQDASFSLVNFQAIPQNVDTDILFVEDFNGIKGLSYDPATGVFTCEEPMVLSICATISFDPSALGTRGLDINFGSERLGCVRINASTVGATRLSTSCIGNTKGISPLVWSVTCFHDALPTLNITAPPVFCKVHRIG